MLWTVLQTFARDLVNCVSPRLDLRGWLGGHSQVSKFDIKKNIDIYLKRNKALILIFIIGLVRPLLMIVSQFEQTVI